MYTTFVDSFRAALRKFYFSLTLFLWGFYFGILLFFLGTCTYSPVENLCHCYAIFNGEFYVSQAN